MSRATPVQGTREPRPGPSTGAPFSRSATVPSLEKRGAAAPGRADSPTCERSLSSPKPSSRGSLTSTRSGSSARRSGERIPSASPKAARQPSGVGNARSPSVGNGSVDRLPSDASKRASPRASPRSGARPAVIGSNAASGPRKIRIARSGTDPVRGSQISSPGSNARLGEVGSTTTSATPAEVGPAPPSSALPPRPPITPRLPPSQLQPSKGELQPPSSPHSVDISQSSPGRSSIGEKLFVLCRCRPSKAKVESCLEMKPGMVSDGANISLYDHQGKGRTYSNFHAVVDSRDAEYDGSQKGVYDVLGPPCVENVLDGISCCVFAYGQTGTGKSHTLLGAIDSDEERGLLPRLCIELFNSDPSRELQVSISCVEVYNDELRDLLREGNAIHAPSKVMLHTHPKLGLHLDGVNELTAHSYEQLLEHVKYATRMRAVAETAMNQQSSRSHAVFIVKAEKPSAKTCASLYIADLAGHENEKSTQATGQRLRELSFINVGLLHLRQVISALAELSSGKKQSAHIPYRNSKLTMLLQETLEGGGRCSTVVTLSQDAEHYDEHLHSLRFAADLSDIRTKPKVRTLANKESLLQKAQEEIEHLKAQLAQAQMAAAAAPEVDALRQGLDQANALANLFKTTSFADLAERTKDHKGLSGMVPQEDATVPMLVNLSDDPHLVGVLGCEIPAGLSIVGSAAEATEEERASGTRRITVYGLGVVPDNLYLRSGGSQGPIEAVPLDNAEARVLVNGVRLHEPRVLQHGDRIIIGYRAGFQLVMPGMGPLENADEEASIDNELHDFVNVHPESRAMAPFVDFLKSQAGELKARVFLRKFRRLQGLVDEANYITSALVTKNKIIFNLQVAMAAAGQEAEVDLDFVVLLTRRSFKAAGKTVLGRIRRQSRGGNRPSLANVGHNLTSLVGNGMGASEKVGVWSIEKFQERLKMMRELLSLHLMGDQTAAQLAEHPEGNPWADTVGVDHPAHQEDTEGAHAKKIKELTDALDRANEEIARVHSTAREAQENLANAREQAANAEHALLQHTQDSTEGNAKMSLGSSEAGTSVQEESRHVQQLMAEIDFLNQKAAQAAADKDSMLQMLKSHVGELVRWQQEQVAARTEKEVYQRAALASEAKVHQLEKKLGEAEQQHHKEHVMLEMLKSHAEELERWQQQQAATHAATEMKRKLDAAEHQHTARIVVSAPSPAATALVTIDRHLGSNTMWRRSSFRHSYATAAAATVATAVPIAPAVLVQDAFGAPRSWTTYVQTSIPLRTAVSPGRDHATPASAPVSGPCIGGGSLTMPVARGASGGSPAGAGGSAAAAQSSQSSGPCSQVRLRQELQHLVNVRTIVPTRRVTSSTVAPSVAASAVAAAVVAPPVTSPPAGDLTSSGGCGVAGVSVGRAAIAAIGHRSQGPEPRQA